MALCHFTDPPFFLFLLLLKNLPFKGIEPSVQSR